MRNQDPEQKASRKSSFGATVKVILWAFLGIRKKRDYEKDAAQLNPVHVIIAGIVGALIFIAVLITIVKMVVAQ